MSRIDKDYLIRCHICDTTWFVSEEEIQEYTEVCYHCGRKEYMEVYKLVEESE